MPDWNTVYLLMDPKLMLRTSLSFVVLLAVLGQQVLSFLIPTLGCETGRALFVIALILGNNRVPFTHPC